MNVIEAGLPDVLIVEPGCSATCGFFVESFDGERYKLCPDTRRTRHDEVMSADWREPPTFSKPWH